MPPLLQPHHMGNYILLIPRGVFVNRRQNVQHETIYLNGIACIVVSARIGREVKPFGVYIQYSTRKDGGGSCDRGCDDVQICHRDVCF